MMFKMRYILISILFLTVFLSACGSGGPDVKGVLLDVNDGSVLLSENLTLEEYEQIKDISAKDLQNEDVNGDRDPLNLISFSYDKTESLNAGDSVDVWLDGDIMNSYPSKSEAKKIKVIK